MQIVTETNIVEFPLVSRGKVRDIYEIGSDTLLIVTTDRMSAFDVIMKEPVPYKGVVLNMISLFWMRRFAHLVKNHILEDDIERFPEELRGYHSMLEGRSVLVRKATPLPVECIVRGHISGSGWKDYTATGEICGHALPRALQESQELAEPLFTPSTKAAPGSHDENISRVDGMRLIGKDLFLKIEEISLAIFRQARDYAATRGIIIADTKFEFGLIGSEMYLIDEALTPDSSRFWPKKGFVLGASQPSFDKQYLRDWLASQPWDKTSPPPALPESVITETARKYREAYAILTDKEFDPRK
ncbi:MAG: phosphoribosylaminoimidazolesuccinocarboxamide synthase [Desulfovibrio sp.]|jgi:phosphoribosylaminoimidazole-succinocarboxamide synthase|nr:phosphoribosylaminoimidazolesuccinocarboxamide synthase [Desulfovibrio sp.]